MQGRRAFRTVVVVLVAVAFVSGGVRLADPFRPDPNPRSIDASDGPARIAHGAMMRTEEADYVAAIYAGNGTEREPLWTVRVDNSDREYRLRRSPDSGLALDAYVGDGAGWSRRLGGEEDVGRWRLVRGGDFGATMFVEEAVVLREGADVVVASRNRSTLVLRIEDTDAAMRLGDGVENATAGENEAGYRASLTLVVDRRQGVLRRSVYRWSAPTGTNDSREVRVRVRKYRRWGEVDVERPAELPYSFEAVVYDLRNGGER